ncbi:MAG TPA: glutamate--cysteine ligase, partial [Gammaproteobacteria bacterium]|nr:glutamate--cysteine ligase [Gammaproteobacteria bacterium]
LWEKIGVVVNGRYEQLNTNILQIENEYYSTVRPKQVLQGLEKPVLALARRGVRYIELRSLDVNAYDPLGVSAGQLNFLEAFLLFCLFQDSPPISVQEQREIDQNQGGVAHRGRDPSLYLLRQGREIKLRQWAGDLCNAMSGICEILDGHDPEKPYSRTLRLQLEKIGHPDRTPSARMLAEMRNNGEGFFQFAQRLSLQHHNYFSGISISAEREAFFRKQAEISLSGQAELESRPQVSFEQFLRDYFAQ